MRYYYLLILLTLTPLILSSQIYDPDSIFVNKNYTIWGHYKNGLKHGSWDYRDSSDFNKVVKYQIYWYGKVIFEDTTNIRKNPMIDLNDSIIKYDFDVEINYVLQKLIEFDSGSFLCCELLNDCDSIFYLKFHKFSKQDHTSIIKKASQLSNRYILIKDYLVPVLTQDDFRFGQIGAFITGSYFTFVFTKNYHLLRIYNEFEHIVTFDQDRN